MDNLKQLLSRMDAAASNENHELAALYAEKARRASPNYNPANTPRDSLSDKGAPMTTRMLVGASDEGDKLTNLRKHYPEAMPVGDDNYAYFDREEGRPTIYNPEGFLRMDTITGDLAENFGFIPEVAGGALATLPASVSGPGVFPAAGLGATLAGEGYDMAVRGALGGTDSRDFGDRMYDSTVDFVWNSLPIPEALKKVGSKISPPVRDFLTSSNDAIKEVLNKYDIAPTAGVIGNKAIGILDAVQQKSMVTVDAWQKRYDEMLDGFGRMVDDFQTSLGGKQTPTSAGMDLIQRGQSYQKQFIDTSQTLSDELAEMIPPGTMVSADETVTLLKQYADAFKNDPAFQKLIQNSYPQALSGAFEAQNGQLSYEALSALRTRIGGMIKNNESIGDVTQGELKQIYKAMTKDKFAAADSMGGAIGDVARKFNDHYKAGMDVQEKFVEPLMMNNGNWVDPAEATKRVSGLINKPQTAADLRDSGVLEEGDFNAVASSMFDDIGQATGRNQNAAGDQLSPSRVLTQSSKMSDEAQEIFLNQDSKTILADMRAFAESTRDVERMVNNSNTGAHLQTGEALAGAGAAVGSLVAGDPVPAIAGSLYVFTQYMASKGIQSDAFTGWLRNAPVDASKVAVKKWKAAGKRIAINNGFQNVFDAWSDGFGDFSKNEGDGVLEE